MGIRKNQKALTNDEWSRLIDAIDKTHGVGAASPAYRDFVKVHVQAMSMPGMSWGVHTMMGVQGRNFLAWHRWFIRQFEKTLQKIDASVSLPYWDAITDRQIPQALDNPVLLTKWSISRSWNPSVLPTSADLASVVGTGTFVVFQAAIEGAVHGGVHNAVGGDMKGSSSPADPLFWLHHANIDRTWSKWQVTHVGQDPANLTEKLKPTPIFKVKVQDALNIATLGYSYQ